MNVAHPIAEKVLARLGSRQGAAVSAQDFLDLGARSAVDQALSRLVRQGAIRRVRRGLYELPRMGRLLNEAMVQSPDDLAQAWAGMNGLRVVPSGAQAANLLGLSTQVPAKTVYYTNGRTRMLTLGPYSIKLLNRGPKTMDVGGQMAPLVFQALRHLGRSGVTPDAIDRLRLALSRTDKRELKDNLRYTTAWMIPVIEQIVSAETD
jgi:hypothetical protein